MDSYKKDLATLQAALNQINLSKEELEKFEKENQDVLANADLAAYEVEEFINKNVKLNNLDFTTLSYVLSRVVAEIFEKHGKIEGKSMDKEFEQFYAMLQVIRPVIRVRLATEGK